jgi:hypothetical protein
MVLVMGACIETLYMMSRYDSIRLYTEPILIEPIGSIKA